MFPEALNSLGSSSLPYASEERVLPNQTRVDSPACSKANPLTLGRGEGKYSICCRAPSKENGQLMLKRPELPMAFREGVLKAMGGRGLQGV